MVGKEKNMKISALVLCATLLITGTLYAGYDVEREKPKDLGMSNIVFCSTSPEGYMKYKKQPETLYTAGDTVWVYLNIERVSFNPLAEGQREVWIKLLLRVKSPDGKDLLKKEVYNERKKFERKFDLSKMFLRVNIPTTPTIKAGKYTVEFRLIDNLSGKESKESSTFTIKEKHPEK